MQQPLIPRADRSRGEYSIQPTDDHEDFNDDIVDGKKPAVVRRPGKAPNYKPKPLKWPFITGLVVMLCVAIALVAYAERALPDSESDAIIVDSPAGLPNSRRRLFIRQNTTVDESTPGEAESSIGAKAVSNPTVSPTVVSILVESSEASAGKQAPTSASGASQVPAPTGETSDSPSPSEPTAISESVPVISDGRSNRRPTASGDGDIGKQDTGASSVISGLIADTSSLPSNLVPIGTSVLTTTLGSTTLPESTITTVVNMTSVTTFTSMSTVTSGQDTTITTVFETSVRVFPSGNATGSFLGSSWTQTQVTMTTTSRIPAFESYVLSEVPVPVTSTVTSETTIESTVPATVAPVTGEVTVTYYTTAPIPGEITATIKNDPNRRPETAVNRPGTPVETIGVTVIDGATVTTVETPTPVVIVVPTGQVKTFTADPQVRVGTTQFGGAPVTSFLVLTPTPASPTLSADIATTVGGNPVTVVTQQPPRTFESVINGVLQTVVETPPARTIISTEGGTLTTVRAILTAAPGQPITFTVVSDVEGTPVTQVVVSTPAGGVSFLPITFPVTTSVGATPRVVTITPEPTSFVTTIDGTPITMFTTPPVTSFTTTEGGSLTTTNSVITPTGTGLITITFVSTTGGTLTTFTSTISPGSTFVSTISGTLTTITSTPSPTTRTSTRSKTTSTFTSTLTSTDSAATPTSTVIGSTRVFKWTESDIFVGTFLPPLFGVALVIPLRIIDLNAKLYQPFQSLAQQGGGSGAETLTMQYTGFMTFITPIITLLQGHPVPFLTTLMVLCGSFIVPLATEAIGLKLHGRCVRNTAVPGCGPSLGVSPAPAHALIGLIVAVILLLLIVLFLTSRWATGVHANPWNIAGIASLAGNPAVRVRQNSEKAMKQAVSQKQYGLGYFTPPDGDREEYGIVLTDESGRGLHEHDEGHDSDGLIDSAGGTVGGKRTNSANNLPLMPLRYPWRLALIAFELGLLIFIIYYHVYYHVTLNEKGRVFDDGRLWEFMNANTFGVRFVAAIVGVIIAFCWQSFFLSVSIMAPYQAMALRTQPPERSILLSPCTNPFSGLYSALKQRHPFLFATSLAAILSELLPVFLANVFFSLSQTSRTATACASIASIILGLSILVLVSSFFVKWPPMPVDPRSIAGMMYYVSLSHMLAGQQDGHDARRSDFEGMSELNGHEREKRVREKGRRYFYGVLVGGSWRRLGVDCDLGTGPVTGVGPSGLGHTGLGLSGGYNEGYAGPPMVDTSYYGVGGVAGGLMSGGLAEGGRPPLGMGTISEEGEAAGSGSGSGGLFGGHGRSISRDSRSAGGSSGVSRIDEPPALHEHDEGLLASSGGMRGGAGGGFLGPSFADRVAGALGRSGSTASGLGTGLLGTGGATRGGYDTIPPPPPGMFRDRGDRG
ncbi:Zonadhesin [Rhypophila sp. PSN 637]